MARMKRRSNPTGLIELSHSQVRIELYQECGLRSFALKHIDLGRTVLPPDAAVICVVRAGRSAERHDLGRLESWDKSPKLIEDIDSSQVPRFRVLIRDPKSSRLLASAENVRLRDPGQSESLIPIEIVDLGQLAWRYREDDDDDGAPTLQVNRHLYPSAAAVEQDVRFISLVLPEALRRVCQALVKDPDGLDDPSNWQNHWSQWLIGLGVNMPPDPDTETWIEGVVQKFCESHEFCTMLLAERDADGGKP